MDSSQTSMNQTRPSTSGLIELHVYYVPDDLWNTKLNKVSTDVINKFISVGFIRVSPEMRLRTLRERLGEFLGDEAVTEKFVFLKSVGRSLAVVKSKQEQELKLKAFVPPYAAQPELYLLPRADNEGSTYGSSVTPEEPHYGPEFIGFDGSGERRLNIPERDQPLNNEQKQPLPTQHDGDQPLHNERGEPLYIEKDLTLHHDRDHILQLEKDQLLYTEMVQTTSSEMVPPPYSEPLNPSHNESTRKAAVYSQEDHVADPFKWTRKEPEIAPVNVMQYHVQVQQKEDQILPRRKEPMPTDNLKKKEKASISKENKRLTGRNATRDSGIPESLGGRETEYSHKKRKEPVSKNTAKTQTGKHINQRHTRASTIPLSPTASSSASVSSNQITAPPHSNSHVLFLGETVLEQLNKLKEERIHLEKSREELVKKTKSLLEQYKLKRYQARDSWKKKYFETKKTTSVLEETLNKLRTDLEIYFQKLLTQLAARDSKKRTKYPMLAGNSKNAVILQITKKQHEIDQLKRKVENARIKLMIEIKMRKQASSDLNVLKAELAQKKAQATLTLTPVFAL
ncbi:spermatogenesis-associated protein 1 [Discoglossus pictus]